MTLSEGVDKKIKLRRIGLIVFILVLILSAFFIINTRTSYFNIKEIIVHGNEQISKDKIILASGINIDDNIFDLKINSSKKHILKHPYIKNIRITRKYPNKIVINVNERNEKFIINLANTFILIDEEGLILNIISDSSQNEVPILKGLKIKKVVIGNNAYLEGELELLQVIDFISTCDKYDLYNKIDYVDFSDLNNIYIKNKSDLNIVLGDLSKLDYKINSTIQIIENLTIKGISKGTVYLNNEGNPFYSPDDI